MKRLALSFFVASMAAATSFAQQAPAASPRVTTESENVVVSYGQPSKKGRQIFGSLVPYDKVWRTGANQATEVTFKKPVSINGTKLAAGTYSLFTVPGKKTWKVIFNSELNQWGAYKYDQIKEKDVAVIKLKPRTVKDPVEALTFTATDSAILLQWDTTSVSIPLKF